MTTAPIVIRNWAVDWLLRLHGSRSGRSLVNRIANDPRMLDVWQRLARAKVNPSWYQGECETLLEDWLGAGVCNFSVCHKGLPEATDLAMVHFANACLAARGFHSEVMPAKPAAEILEDWRIIKKDAAEMSRKLRALLIESASVNDLAFLLSSLLRRHGATEDDIRFAPDWNARQLMRSRSRCCRCRRCRVASLAARRSLSHPWGLRVCSHSSATMRVGMDSTNRYLTSWLRRGFSSRRSMKQYAN